MFFIRVILNSVLLLLIIGCGDINEYDTNSTNAVEQIAIPTSIPTQSPTPTPSPTSTIEPITDSVDIDTDNNSNDSFSASSSPIDTILNNRPVVESNQNSTVTETQTDTTPNRNIIYKDRFINSSCDQILDKEFLVICYDYGLKMATSVAYLLEGDLVEELNIADRPSFYEEELIEKRYRATYSDYTHSGYDRGHLAPDASFDWSIESLEATYSLANIIPQVPIVNREVWARIEGYAREKAKELGELNVVNVIKFNSTPTRIGDNKIAVPIGYYKILYNQYMDYEECFYYGNNTDSKNLDINISSHIVSCSNI
jgi:endonuclease G